MSTNSLFREADFKSYLVKEAGLKENTAASYVSYIKTLDRDFITQKVSHDGLSRLEILLGNLPDRAFAFVQSVLETVKEAKRSKDESLMPIVGLQNGYSALSQYYNFLVANYYGKSKPHSGEDDEVETIEDTVDEDSDDVIVFSKDDLVKRIRGRLVTQDRPGLFSIRLINSIFNGYQQQGEQIENRIRTFYPKFESFAAFIRNWISEMFDTTKVLSKDDCFFMRDVYAFELYPKSKVVKVMMESGYKFTLYTRKHPDSEERVPMTEGMRTMRLRSITLEHAPSMLSILQNNASRLQGIGALSAKMTQLMKEHDIPKCPWFGALRELQYMISFQDIEDYISDIVKDLLFIKEQAHIELMGDKFNVNRGNNMEK